MLAPIPRACRLLIIGAGLAGLELASQLRVNRRADVVILEAGLGQELRHVNMCHAPAEALRLWLESERDPCFHRSWITSSPPHYTGSSGLRRRIGGRSLYWHGVALPIEEWALQEPWWPPKVVADLTCAWQQGPPLYTRVARDLSEWRGEEVAIAPHYGRATWIGEHSFVPTPIAVRRGPPGSDRWFAYSPLDHWRDPVTGDWLDQQAPFLCCAGIEAVRLLLDHGRVCGAVARATGSTEEIRVWADAVVLAAGTIESTRLAIQALWEVGALTESWLGGLADHIVQGVVARLPAAQAARLTDLLPAGAYLEACDVARSNLFLTITPGAEGDVLVDLQLTGEQMPSAESMIKCEPSARFPWEVHARTVTSREDEAVIAGQQDILQEVWNTLASACGAPVRTLAFADYNKPERNNDCFLIGPKVGDQVTWSNSLGTEDHEGGTLPIGRLLDDDLQFIDVPGLHAVGPVAFPRLGAANPALTVLALARRLAARIRCYL